MRLCAAGLATAVARCQLQSAGQTTDKAPDQPDDEAVDLRLPAKLRLDADCALHRRCPPGASKAYEAYSRCERQLCTGDTRQLRLHFLLQSCTPDAEFVARAVTERVREAGAVLDRLRRKGQAR